MRSERRHSILPPHSESSALGLPALVALAQRQDGATKYLAEARKRFENWLPIQKEKTR
jgi:hypothetical protein